ncbi:unnamed protein product [Medioppia subpectinata]|nr:unnamed protein product [Medioppia subpectinata]CAG2105408.1 unnamed protein product [Medioppia subpectinata]
MNNNNNNVRRDEESPISSNLKQLIKELMAELLGTYMLMLIGCSATCAYVLNIKGIPDKHVDYAGVNYCWGFGAFVGICASMAISGGHINPAVSIAFATLKRFPWQKVGPYILAQVVGAFLGTATAYLVYVDQINTQHDLDPLRNNTDLRAFGHALSTGGIFSTYPAPHSTLLVCIIDQVVATCSLLISVCVVVDKNNLNVPMYLQPFLLAFVIATHAQAFGFNTGCGMNPARDFGPRLFTAIAGWGFNVFSPLDGHYWWTVGIVGPTIGAVLGVWIYYYAVEYFYSPPKPVDTIIDGIHERKPVFDGPVFGRKPLTGLPLDRCLSRLGQLSHFDTYNKETVCDGVLVDLELCDTAGLDDMRRLRYLTYLETDVFIVCFSIVSPKTFHNVINKWIPEMKESLPNKPFILVVANNRTLDGQWEYFETVAQRYGSGL